MTDIPILVKWKNNSYEAILVIVNRLTKMVYYKALKTIIDVSQLAQVSIDIVARYHGLPESIISDYGSLFISKFWFL